MSRSYGQNCGLACALDLVGERWTALVIRELSRGPKRFRDLLDGLDGIGTNLLSARLKNLEAAGVIERVTLPAPAGVAAYDLTPRGRALQEPLEALALWGFPLVRPGDPDRRNRAVWAAMSMRAGLDRAGADVPSGIYAFDVDDEAFWLRVADGHTELRDGEPPFTPDVHVTGSLDAFLALATRGEGDVTVTGDGDRFIALMEVFRLPALAD